MKTIFKKNYGINFFIAFSFFVFGPIEIYMSNQSNFWFSLMPIIICSLFMFIIVLILCVLMDCTNNKYINLLKGLLWGYSLALYIQGNFINADYGILDGTPIDWNLAYSSTYRVANVLIWLIIISAAMFFYYKKPKLMQVVASCIILTQFVTLITMLLTNGVVKKSQINATTDGEFEYSANHNIIVICADGFDSGFFDRALKENPELSEQFDGFTYYRNTIGSSLWTDESVIPLLTGNILEEDGTYSENVNQAYEKSNIYKILKDNAYNIGIYESNSAVLVQEMEEFTENVKVSKAEINSYSHFAKLLYKLVAFKYMPHELKQFFWMSTTDFTSTKTSKALDYYTWDNIDFYNGIATISTVSDKTNSYKYYHIQGPHEPVVMDENVNPINDVIQMDDENYANGQYQQTLGVIKIFKKLIDQLKKIGVYNNSTIIFTADHGWDIRPWPLLMIKPENASGEMIVSEQPISIIEDYMPTLEAIAQADWDNPNAIFNLKETNRKRPFYVYDINESDRTYRKRQAYITTAKSAEEIFQYSSWYFPLQCNINKNSNSRTYIKEFDHDPGEYAWIVGNSLNLMLQLNGDHDNLVLGLEYAHVYHNSQQVEIYANDKLVAEYVATGSEEVQIIIPKEYITEQYLQLSLKFPDATSPKQNGESDDARILSLGMTGLYFSSTNNHSNEVIYLTK